MSQGSASVTSIGYNPIKMLREFLKLEASGGLVLLFCALLAMVIANSGLAQWYHHLFHGTKLQIVVGPFGLEKDLIHWVNDGLMAIFFFLVGLEIKREMMEGALSSFKQAVLPGIAALGGMAVPGVIYYITTLSHPEAVAGWAVPTATDIAFAMGVLALLGRKVPITLKIFLLALAIFDDLGAIVIIALFYSSHLDIPNLLLAALFLAGLLTLNRLNVSKGSFYLVLGIALWFCVLKSGVHATLAGVVVAMTIPLEIPGERRSLLRQLEHDLHPLVAYIILPMFAFANAGVSLAGMSFGVLFEPVTLGVIAGLFIGKQVGIFGTTFMCVQLGLVKLPQGVRWAHVWGASILAGIGFTMSIFVATLGFGSTGLYITEAKLGILVGSLVSAVVGFAVLYMVGRTCVDVDEKAEDDEAFAQAQKRRDKKQQQKSSGKKKRTPKALPKK